MATASAVDKKCPTCNLVSSEATRLGRECEFCTLWKQQDGQSTSDAAEMTRTFWEYWPLALHDPSGLEKFAAVILGRARREDKTIGEFLRAELKKFPQCCRCERHLPQNQKRPVCKDHRPWWDELEQRVGARFPSEVELATFCRSVAAPRWKGLVGSDGARLEMDGDTWELFLEEIEPVFPVRARSAAPSSTPQPRLASPPPPPPASKPAPVLLPRSAAPPPIAAPAAASLPAPQVVPTLPTLGRKWTPGEKQWVFKNGREVAKLFPNPTPEEFSAIFFWREEHFKKCGVSGHKARAAGVEFLHEILPNVIVPKILAVRAQRAQAVPPVPSPSPAPLSSPAPSVPSAPAPSVADVRAEVRRELELLLAKVGGLKSSAEGIAREIGALEEKLQSLVPKGEA